MAVIDFSQKNSLRNDTWRVDFKGRRILLVVPKFFGYDKEIVSRLVARGASVDVYDDRPSTSALVKTLNRINRSLISRSASSYVDRIIENSSGKVFDDIVIVKGESFSPMLLKRLFLAFPAARKTFYLWDSLKNAKGSREKLELFDRCMTFDSVDASNEGLLRFRPLFFVPHYSGNTNPVADIDIDILFVGTLHTDRYKVLKRIKASLPVGVACLYFLYFPAKFIYRFRRIFSSEFWHSEISEFSFKPLSHAENSALYARARAIVDIERVVQTGLTIDRKSVV